MSEVTICNLALASLGDTATVASIAPPDSSVQAQLCARFYPVARDALLEMAAWGFTTRRAALALRQEAVADSSPRVYPDNSPATWRYQYAAPNGMLKALAVLMKDAPDDYEMRGGAWWSGNGDCLPTPQGSVAAGLPLVMPQPFAVESASDGSAIILTNVEDAVLRYTAVVTDTTKFSPMFTVALAWLLASMLAGPLLKGDAGAKQGALCLGMFERFKAEAMASDAQQRKINLTPSVSWMRGR